MAAAFSLKWLTLRGFRHFLRKDLHLKSVWLYRLAASSFADCTSNCEIFQLFCPLMKQWRTLDAAQSLLVGHLLDWSSAHEVYSRCFRPHSSILSQVKILLKWQLQVPRHPPFQSHLFATLLLGWVIRFESCNLTLGALEVCRMKAKIGSAYFLALHSLSVWALGLSANWSLTLTLLKHQTWAQICWLLARIGPNSSALVSVFGCKHRTDCSKWQGGGFCQLTKCILHLNPLTWEVSS